MGEEEPETEDWLCEHIKDGIGDNLSVDIGETSATSNGPDDWVQCPNEKSEATNGTIEGLGLAVLVGEGGSSVDGELEDNNKVGNACNDIPAPLLSIASTEGSEKTGEKHDDIGNDGDENIGTAEAGQESKIDEDEWGGDRPVNITGPVDLTVDHVLVGLLQDGLVVADAITSRHGKVGEEGEGRNEGSQDVEEAFLL
jgi:hypothetical protein